jgi:hypothetical protein
MAGHAQSRHCSFRKPGCTEYWGVTGYRDPRLYRPILAAVTAFVSWLILQTWLYGLPSPSTLKELKGLVGK